MIGDMSQPTTDVPVLLMYAPYLPLREPLDVDGWRLVPVGELDNAESISDFAIAAAKGLAALYSASDNDAVTGAFAYRIGQGLGAVFDEDDVLDMHRALVVMVLDANPSRLAAADEPDGNEAYRAMTSDNALVFGHPIGTDGYVAAQYGGMIGTLSGGYNVIAAQGVDSMRIRPPADLMMPMGRPRVDGELADAAHRVITANDDAARRVHRAIGWLDLAWRNASSITPDLRIPALRSGFETLFDAEGTLALRRALSVLLDDADAPRTHRTWVDQSRRLEDSVTELEWWFVCFTLLRNAIAHGDPLEPENYDFEGVSHAFVAEYRLREAIKATVIASGYPELGLKPMARRLHRAMRKYVKP
jgi:hypothetical protein